jgi:hypothetical protein
MRNCEKQSMPTTYTDFSLRTALFYIVTQRIKAICNRRFGTTYRSHLEGSYLQNLSVPSSRDKTLEDGTGKLSGNVIKKLPLVAAQ